ncbi:hypothetical protein APHAL10511_001692 [Amanita phalloides]|nr:hypothetical protein APHAL10511_001692 [Amanita phalloides]
MPASSTAFTPSHPSDEPHQYRPARDLESFNKLLPPPIEFVEGSSSGMLAVPEGKYEPINASPKTPKAELPEKPKLHPATNGPSSPTSAKSCTITSLFHGGIDTSWPATYNRAVGLINTGNTCFLNSALQCLIHTPPLLRALFAHKDSCRIEKGFCMSCNMRLVAVKAHSLRHAFTPVSISERLQTIAKHMRKGRQEDSHEFLRYAIDALQKSCLAGYPPKLDPKLAETTWVHKIFGGRLRSRVTCHDCGYNSDTFDRILDLSLDILRSESVRDALHKFIAVDYLKGADKYKCEKCKKHVIAEKQFTIHEAPMVLTVHLKRFSPMGRKISHHVDYDDRLSLHPYMSEGKHGLLYSLYGVICHAGGGPNSGHYFAFIKDKDGRWWEMNDEIVSQIGGAPVGKKNAYILFYMRNKGQELEAVVKSQGSPPIQKVGLAASMKKRKERDPERDNEDTGEKVEQPFIGPIIPDAVLKRNTSEDEPPADMRSIVMKKKMEAVKLLREKEKQEKDRVVKEKAAGLLAGLESYNSDEDADDDRPSREEEAIRGSPPNPRAKSPVKSSPTSPTSPKSALPPSSPSSVANEKKRKRDEEGGDRNSDVRRPMPITSRTSGYTTFRPGHNPYNRITKRYGKRRLNPI